MFDFTPVIQKQAKLSELTANLTIDDLRRYTNEMIDTMLGLITACTDAAVTFLPIDPQANDKYAATEADVHLAWTLGHVIVHVTASAEESAFLAAELARGVTFHGRSRSEVPWDSVTSIAQCRDRLEESRRMRLASLELWPTSPHLDNSYEATEAQIAALLTKVIGRAVQLAAPQMPAGAAPTPEQIAMFTFFNGQGYDADIPALRQLYPGLHTLEQWLHLTGWANLPVLPMPANASWGP